MRALLGLLLLPPLLGALPGCTPYIPVKPGFGTSALTPAPDVPPEFAEFNNFNPGVNALLADQMCATPAVPLETKSLGASTGGLIEARSRCATHMPFLGIYQ
jgi:hypothetical protein